jgi:hypothetical protein
MPDIDFFNFFRYALGWIVTIYATVITVQSLWGWYVWLAGNDRYLGILRRYLIVHGLRLRFGSFWGDVLVSLLLTIAFFIMWHAHHLIYDLDDKYKAIRLHANDQVHSRHVQPNPDQSAEQSAGQSPNDSADRFNSRADIRSGTQPASRP